jgi:hypothetical protein
MYNLFIFQRSNARSTPVTVCTPDLFMVSRVCLRFVHGDNRLLFGLDSEIIINYDWR